MEEKSTLQEIKELKDLFVRIKADSEEFISRAKAISETGVHDVKELVEAVKSNWQSVVMGLAGGASLTGLFAGRRSSSDPADAKKSSGAKKPAAKSAGGSSKKAAKSAGTSAKSSGKKAARR